MVDSEMPPKAAGRGPSKVSLSGKVFPWKNESPVFLRMVGSSCLWLPCFSKVDKLRGFLQRIGMSHDRIKVIDNQRDFIERFPRKDGDKEIRFMVDPYFTEEGKVRFLQVLFD